MRVLQSAIAVTLLCSALLTGMYLSIFDYGWYQQQFLVQNLYDRYQPIELEHQTTNLFAYLQGNETLDNQYYTEREILHLRDIKKLVFWLGVVTAIVPGILVLFSAMMVIKFGFKALVKSLLVGSVFSLVMFATFGIAFVFSFDRIFIFLHQLFFRNDFWLLDPATEDLIVIFPPTLFLQLGKVITAKVVLMIGIIGYSSLFVYLAMHKLSSKRQ